MAFGRLDFSIAPWAVHPYLSSLALKGVDGVYRRDSWCSVEDCLTIRVMI